MVDKNQWNPFLYNLLYCKLINSKWFFTSSFDNFLGIFNIEKIVLLSGITYWISVLSVDKVKNSQYLLIILSRFSSVFNEGYLDISGWDNKSFNFILNCSLVIKLILLVSKFSGATYEYNYNNNIYFYIYYLLTLSIVSSSDNFFSSISILIN